MSSSEGSLPQRKSRIRCGGCKSDATFLPGSQELTHGDGSPLCVAPEPEDLAAARQGKAWARYVVQPEYGETRQPRGVAVYMLLLFIVAAAAAAFFYGITRVLEVVK